MDLEELVEKAVKRIRQGTDLFISHMYRGAQDAVKMMADGDLSVERVFFILGNRHPMKIGLARATLREIPKYSKILEEAPDGGDAYVSGFIMGLEALTKYAHKESVKEYFNKKELEIRSRERNEPVPRPRRKRIPPREEWVKQPVRVGMGQFFNADIPIGVPSTIILQGLPDLDEKGSWVTIQLVGEVYTSFEKYDREYRESYEESNEARRRELWGQMIPLYLDDAEKLLKALKEVIEETRSLSRSMRRHGE